MNDLSEKRKFVDGKLNLIKDRSCGMGCSFCCYYEVSITDEEADDISQLIIDGVVDIDKDKLISHAEGNQSRLPYEERRCLFLDEDDLCKIYHNRPFMCRRNIVTSDPENCTSGSRMPVRYQYIKSVEDFVRTLHLDNMPKQILKRLKDAKYL